jgi:hypothetical protein
LAPPRPCTTSSRRADPKLRSVSQERREQHQHRDQNERTELKTLTRKHWQAHLPDKYKELQAEGMLDAATNGAANLAQSEIETLMKAGYQEHEARAVALPMFILLPPEYHEDGQDRELADMEAEYQRNPPPLAGTGDPNEDWSPRRMRRTFRRPSV